MAAHLLRRSWGGTISLLIVILLLSCCSQMTSAAAAPASRKSGGGGGGSSSGTSMSQQNKLDVRQHLKRLNKPPLKTIKSPDGDIIDCVHIAHQPAFDHPLLKNHTIQTRPNFHPDGTKFEESKRVSGQKARSSKPITQLWHLKGRSAQPDLVTQTGHQHAIVYVEGDKYYGAKATINVWEPKIQQPNEFSLSQIWILGGTFGQDLNSIEAGWQVSPDLYGDNRTRLFTYWTSDAYQATGCYNLLCTGFIQINNEVSMGASIFPISGYRESQYDISLLVWKDPKEGNWWLQFGNDYVLGYWPGFLFSYLTDSASMIEWGGEIVNSESDEQHTTTQMGSGHFPEEGFGKAGYFRNIQIVDGSNSLRDPKGLGTFTEQSSCYNVHSGKSGDWGTYFFYGGPGRNPSCP
ncbi:hypothetical protein OIU76_020638 [Salix suchowensis]|uniref:Neprosin PEP catalytic domain-containing protein n=1 Tax=Salix suchowensis TaxID=1278906 RepID=A0ABQ8ZMS8_9ROSI|nr:hypothetical protein OIU76_020638 [Salix suchowensis]KAJ6303210.1 hypothetical protein OIU77_017149 [Salix suchowensis]